MRFIWYWLASGSEPILTSLLVPVQLAGDTPTLVHLVPRIGGMVSILGVGLHHVVDAKALFLGQMWFHTRLRTSACIMHSRQVEYAQTASPMTGEFSNAIRQV